MLFKSRQLQPLCQSSQRTLFVFHAAPQSPSFASSFLFLRVSSEIHSLRLLSLSLSPSLFSLQRKLGGSTEPSCTDGLSALRGARVAVNTFVYVYARGCRKGRDDVDDEA